MAKTKKQKHKVKHVPEKVEAAKPTEKAAPKAEAAFEQALFHWQAPEYLRFQKGPLWYTVAGLIDAALIAYALTTGSLTMALVFLVLPLVYLSEHARKPKVVDVVISPYGINFGILRIPFSSVKRFYILHNPPYVDELHLLTMNRWHPEVAIPLNGTPPALLRQYLVTQIPEWEGKELSFLDILVRILRLS